MMTPMTAQVRIEQKLQGTVLSQFYPVFDLA
jgi:hypothetical protein